MLKNTKKNINLKTIFKKKNLKIIFFKKNPPPPQKKIFRYPKFQTSLFFKNFDINFKDVLVREKNFGYFYFRRF